MAQVANTAQGGGTARTNKKLQPNVLRRVMTPKTSYSEIMPQLPAPAASSGQDLQQAIQAAQRGETVRPAEWAQYESGVESWAKEVDQAVTQAVKDSEARDGVWQEPSIYEDYRRQQDESIEGLQNRSMQLRAFFDTHRDVYGSEQVDKLLSAMDQNSKRLSGVKTLMQEEDKIRENYLDREEYETDLRLANAGLDELKQWNEELSAQLDELDKKAADEIRRQNQQNLFFTDPFAQTAGAYAAAESVYQDDIDRLTQTRNRVLQRYYELENQQQWQGIQQGGEITGHYQKVQSLRSDIDRAKSLMDYASRRGQIADPGGAAQAQKDKQYLFSTYGISSQSDGAELTGEEYNALYNLYRDLMQRQEEETAALSAGGYDYARMTRYQQTQEDKERYKDFMEQTKASALSSPGGSIASSLMTVPLSPFQGIDYLTQAAHALSPTGDPDDIADYEPLNVYNMHATNYVSGTRGAISEQIEKDLPNAEILGVNVPSLLYQTGMSMLDSGYQVALLGKASLPIMGGAAAANEMQDIIARGGNNQQALLGATAAGIAEVLFEKISVDRLLKEINISDMRSFLKNAAIQSGVEITEEGLTKIANIYTDTAVMGRDSRSALAEREYRLQGKSREAAQRQVFFDNLGEVVLSGVGGGISGFGMGGIAGGLNWALGGGQYNAVEPMQYQNTAQFQDTIAQTDPLAQTAREMALEAMQEPAEVPAAPAMQEPAPAQQGPSEAAQRSGGPYPGYSLDELFAQLPDSDAPQMQSAADVGRDGLVFDSVGDGRSPQETIAPARRSTDTNRATGGGPSRPALQQLAQDFGQAGRQAFAEAWDGRDSAQYYAGFAAWYQAGLDGKSADQVRGPYAGNISAEGRQIAYNAGQMDAALSLEQEKASAPYAKSAGAEAGLRYADSVQAAIDAGETVFTPEQVERIEAAARAFGVNVYVVDHIDAGIEGANGDIDGSDILIARDAKDPLGQVIGHEFTHRLQELAPEQFRTFRQAALDNMADSAVQAKLDRYHTQGEQLQYEKAMNDVAADYAGRLLEDGQLLDQFIERHREDRTLLQKLRDVFRGLWEKLTGAERRRAQSAEGKLSAVLDAAAEQAPRLLDASPVRIDVEGTEGTLNQDGAPSRRALQTDVPEGQSAEGKALYSIKETDDGKKYVQEDRTAILGDDPRSWREQLEDYINGKIRRGENVQLIAEDGDVLTLTAQTAGKVASPHTSYGTTLSKEDYYIKARAGAHIDELSQVSKSQGKTKADIDARHGDFASGGWQYRTAYFRDADGKYYQLGISVAQNKNGNIVYNIGEIRRRSLSNTADLTATGSSAKGGAQSVEKTSSDTTLPQSGEESKPQYSLKDTTITKTYNQLLRENDALRERVDYWRGQTRTTKEITTDKKSVNAAAKALVKEYGAQLDTKELTGRLQALYDHMARTLYDKGETEGSDVWKGAEEIARDIAESSVEEWSLAQEFPGLREKLRDTSITVGHEYDGDIRNENFRRDYRGKLKLSAQGPTNVDAVYAELSESYPGLFPEDITHPADQLEQIMEVADSLATVEQQRRFSGQMDEAVMGITNEIVEQFLDMPLTRATFADEQAAKLDKLRQENREAVQNAIAKEQLARESQVKELKSKYKARTEAGRERQKAGELRQKITRHAKKLSDKLLHPTDKAHIPEELRGPVARVLASLHTGSTYETYFDHKNAEYVKGKQGEVLGAEQTKRTQAFLELKQKYAEIAKNGGDMVIDADLLGSDAEGIQGSFDAVIAMGDTPIDTLNSRQLGTMWQVLKSVEHSVSTAGKLLNQGKYQRTAEWAGALAKDTANRRDSRSRRIGRSLENPYTFFSHFGQAGKDIYRTLRNAQDQQQLLTNRVADEVAKVVDEKTVKQLAKTTHRFTTEGGQELTLSTAQVMDILNLMGREQALNHLLVGGMVQPEVRAAKVRRGTESIRLTANDLADITGVLTAEQRKIAGGLQQIAATTLADMGNEASMTAYGYKKFTEPNYWPIRSARESLHSNIEKGGDNARSIKNIGMAKATVPHASNPVDVGSVFDTFARHTGDMVDYAAWLVPMEDLNRVYNYQYRDGEGNPTGKTVKGLLDAKGGEGSQKYWQDLMEDIQNGIKAKSDDPIVDLASRGVGAFKGAAVGGNIRVIIQQPTAFFRAGAVLNPADMTLGLTKGATKGNGWKKALEYSPIAMRKDAGGFDISAPGTMQETLFGGKNAVQKVNDALSWGAGKADAVTWGKLWNACEWQVARQHKELPKGSKAYYEEVNRVFTDMVDQTQVVDGILQRSNIMRTSNAMGQQATSFMGEPIMSLNLTMRAWDQLRNEQDPKKRGKAIKNFGRAATALTVTAAVNALAQSLIDAMRDDDRDKKYWERFRSAFTGQTGEEETPWEKAWAAVMEGNFGSNLNPAGQIPYVKDIQSLIQGYSVTRTELSVIEDLIENGKNFVKNADGHGGKTQAYALNRLLASAAKIFGIPVANLERDLWAMIRTAAIETDNIPAQYQLEKAIYNIGSEKNKSRFVDLMYRALESGEMDIYGTIQDDLMNVMGMDGAALESALKGKYTAKAKADPAYSIPQQSYDLLGIRPGGKSEKEEGFGPGDLDNEAYKDYAAQRAADYRQAEDALSGNPIFKGMDDETKDKILQAAFDMSKEWALEDASNGEYNTDKVWIADGRQAKKEGIDPWEFAIWNVTKNDTESVKEDGKEVKGQTRKDQLSDWLKMSDFSEEQREFLWGIEYNDDYGAYRDELAEYRAYGPQMDAAYSEMTESLADNPIFTGMDKETRDKVTDAAMKLAKQRAQAEVIDGFEYDAEWIEQASGAETMGISPDDYILWHVVYNETKNSYDANDKPIKGQEKKDKLRSWLKDRNDLTYDQQLWLWRTEYSPKTPF